MDQVLTCMDQVPVGIKINPSTCIIALNAYPRAYASATTRTLVPLDRDHENQCFNTK